MILKTAYYDSSIDMHSALSTESNFLTYTLNHEFNQPATATIVLADPTGSMAQKYDVATNSVYVGSGRAYIEDPDNTCVFDGRIIKARHDTNNGRVILLALDWMHQLSDARQHYDMREDLDGNGLRQSEVHTDIDGDKQPVEDVGGTYYLNDDDMSWAVDEFNDKYVIFTNEMAGNITVGTGPYDEVVTTAGAPMTVDLPANGEENVWVDDTNLHNMSETNADFDVVYYFRTYVNQSDFYVASSISAARVHVVGLFQSTNAACTIQICNDFATPGYVPIETVPSVASTITKRTYEIPEQYLSSMLHTDGTARVKFDVVSGGAVAAFLYTYYIWLEVDVETTGYSSAVLINDTLRGHADGDADYHTLEVGTDLSIAGIGIWEGCPYSITKEIYKHVDEMVQPTVNRAKQCDGGVFDDQTTEAQDATADDMNLLATAGNPAVNDYYVFGFDRPIDSLTLNIGTAGEGAGVDPWIITWQYYKDGVGFSNLAGVTDGTDSFQNAGIRKVSWTEPTDWVEATVDGTTTYWLSAKVTTFNNISVKPLGTQAWQGIELYPFFGRSIESTTNFSTKHYSERTILEILTDLSKTDKTVFWVTLGGTVFNWKKTFNDGSPTEITDASVLAWSGGEYDYVPMVNEYHIYGIRVNDGELFVDTADISPDPGVDSKAKYGVVRSEMLPSTGTTSEYEATELGNAIVERNEDVHLYLQASIHGLSSLRLGSEVNINSTLLGLTDQKYVITHWSFNSESYRTTIRLHPRSSIGYADHLMFGEHIRQLADKAKEADLNTYSANLTTQTWTQ